MLVYLYRHNYEKICKKFIYLMAIKRERVIKNSFNEPGKYKLYSMLVSKINGSFHLSILNVLLNVFNCVRDFDQNYEDLSITKS